MGRNGPSRTLKIAPDTNILIRILTNDDAEQAEIGRQELSDASAIILSSSVLCETAWVLKRFFGASREEISQGIRALVSAENAVFDSYAVDVGLRLMDAGGDFADGVIAASGIGMGAEAFVSLDRRAVCSLTGLGVAARTPDQP